MAQTSKRADKYRQRVTELRYNAPVLSLPERHYMSKMSYSPYMSRQRGPYAQAPKQSRNPSLTKSGVSPNLDSLLEQNRTKMNKTQKMFQPHLTSSPPSKRNLRQPNSDARTRVRFQPP